jgi:hypothetical protein
VTQRCAGCLALIAEIERSKLRTENELKRDEKEKVRPVVEFVGFCNEEFSSVGADTICRPDRQDDLKLRSVPAV